MRIVLAALSLVPLVALAACGSEESVRATFRQASIDGCLAASRGQPTPPAMANFDWNRLCTCATDRIMEGKSATELAQLRPEGPGQTQAVEQCVREMMPGAAPAAADAGAAAGEETGEAAAEEATE